MSKIKHQLDAETIVLTEINAMKVDYISSINNLITKERGYGLDEKEFDMLYDGTINQLDNFYKFLIESRLIIKKMLNDFKQI